MDTRLQRREARRRRRRLNALGVSVVLALVMTLVLVSALSAQEVGPPIPVDITSETDDVQEVKDDGVPTAPDLSVVKSVDKDEAMVGETIAYTVVISNSGDSGATNVEMSDTLPDEVTYIAGSLSAPSGVWGEAGGVISWTGSIMNQDMVMVTFSAEVDAGVPADTTIENTAEVTWSGNSYSDTATTVVIEQSAGSTNYLPAVFTALPEPPDAPVLSVSRASYENRWTVAWTDVGSDVTYELEESLTPDFASPTVYGPLTGNSIEIQQEVTEYNEFYYRVRGVGQGGAGDWSNVGTVIGGYRDDFTNNIDGWGIRRTTLIEEVQIFHEVRDDNGLLILRVEDSWDWGIASPMVKAPPPPYVIEYRTQLGNLGNLVSHGLALGADWPTAVCPDWTTLPGVYEHDYCFNHFYLPNIIWYGPMKLAFERVDYLIWCPGCGGSPMKRLSTDYGSWFEVDPLNNANPDGWNTWKVEVRNDGLRLFVNGQQYAAKSDTTYVNEPYFGVFGSTDEYSNSTTRWDYVEVRPLDN